MPAAPTDLRRHVLADEVVVGVSDSTPEVDPGVHDLLLTSAPEPPRPWVSATPDEVDRAVAASPAAAVALVQVLRATELLPVPTALTVESLAYSMLQHGAVFTEWLQRRPVATHRPTPTGGPVRLERSDHRLEVVLHRPEVHNALDASMRDGLCEAFDLVAADPSITEVHLRGDGPSFCSGGDLAEFGSARDAAAAHMVRTTRSVGRRVHDRAEVVTAHLHGACIGAGIEISAFAGRVVAATGTTIRLPEVAMGLIPGAGGTVSITRRIGRHRTAWLALTGRTIDQRRAHEWGLVDEVVDRRRRGAPG